MVNHRVLVPVFLTLQLCVFTLTVRADEPLFRDLPPGVFVQRSNLVPARQAAAIGRKLGGRIERLSNSTLRVHGRTIQVNVISAADAASARAIHASLGKIKSFPYCLRKGAMIVEHVGRNVDEALAMKTSYELGLLAKPREVTYQVTAELAAIDRADYMACNDLFNAFLALERSGTGRSAAKQLATLTARFTFGKSLVLRTAGQEGRRPQYRFENPPVNTDPQGSVTAYVFDRLPERHGVPFVKVEMTIYVGASGFVPDSQKPAPELTRATRYWPVQSETVLKLAREITSGASTNEAKAAAILQWLAPGSHLRYSGKTGSRWGVEKVLQQEFGHCWDFSDCFVTLCRASGVPARQVAGWLYGGSGHVWAEYYREGQGWQQVDPTGGGKFKCGIYHIPYFTTEDGEMPIVYLSMPRIVAKPRNEPKARTDRGGARGS